MSTLHRQISSKISLIILMFLSQNTQMPVRAQTQGSETRNEAIALEIAIVLGEPEPTLAFTLTNNGKTDLNTPLPGTAGSRFVIIQPDGEEVEIFYFVRMLEPTIVKPSQSKTWKQSIRPLFEVGRLRGKLEMPGTYRLYWKQKDPNQNPNSEDASFKYISNTVLILQEKSGQK